MQAVFVEMDSRRQTTGHDLMQREKEAQEERDMEAQQVPFPLRGCRSQVGTQEQGRRRLPPQKVPHVSTTYYICRQYPTFSVPNPSSGPGLVKIFVSRRMNTEAFCDMFRQVAGLVSGKLLPTLIVHAVRLCQTVTVLHKGYDHETWASGSPLL